MRIRFSALLLASSLACVSAFIASACSGDGSAVSDTDTDSGGGGADTGTSSRDSSTGDDDSGSGDASKKDAAETEDAGCTPIVTSLDAGGACGTMDFGAIAAPFGPVDGGADPYKGGVFPAGVYDAVGAERASGSGGSWRETFVSDGAGRFTRIRQIDTNASDASLGPITRRSGTYAATGNTIKFTYDCAYAGGAPLATPPDPDTLPFEILTSKCDATYRYGVTGIRLTLKRR